MDEDEKVARAAPMATESDDEEDMPDYRVLSTLSQRHIAGSTSTDTATPFIPKRGEKDFEPTGFGGQSKILEQSRAALFTAISLPRAHSSKSLCTATWDPVFQRAFVHTQRGQSCAHVGVSERRVCGDKTITHLELFPEEAVYLIERGALDCRWTQTPGDIPSSELFATSIPISVAQAYAQLLGRDGATLARYQIYAYLKRLGYIVQRTSVIDRIRQGMTATPSKPRLHVRWTRSLWQFLFRVMSRVWCLFFCLIRRLYRRPRGLLGIAPTDAFDSVYDALRIVPTGHNERPPSTETSAMSPFFYAWRPATHFKRTQPPPPEFRICVLETEKQPMLQGRDFEVLFSHVPLPTADSNDDQDAKALEAIREQNRRAYGKQRPARPRPVSKHPTTRLGPMLARLRRCLDLLSAWLRALCLWAGMPLRTPERLPSNVYLPLKAGRRSVVVAIVDQGTMSLLRFGEAEFARWRIAGHR